MSGTERSSAIVRSRCYTFIDRRVNRFIQQSLLFLNLAADCGLQVTSSDAWPGDPDRRDAAISEGSKAEEAVFESREGTALRLQIESPSSWEGTRCRVPLPTEE